MAQSLGIFLARTKDFHVSGPRDKVHRYLGLLTTAEREVQRPDYQKPAFRVYFDVAKHLLKHDPEPFSSLFFL